MIGSTVAICAELGGAAIVRAPRESQDLKADSQSTLRRTEVRWQRWTKRQTKIDCIYSSYHKNVVLL